MESLRSSDGVGRLNACTSSFGGITTVLVLFITLNSSKAFVPHHHNPRPLRFWKGTAFFINPKASSSNVIVDYSNKELGVSISTTIPPESQLLKQIPGEEEEDRTVVKAENDRKLVVPLESKRDLRIVSGIGIVFTLAYIVVLAMLDISGPPQQVSKGDVVAIVEDVNEILDSVKEAVLPESASDVVSIVLGEGIAGAFGGAADFAITSFVTSKMTPSSVSSLPESALWTPTDETEPDASSTTTVSVSEAVTEAAVAGGDYFLTRAAAMPLLNAMGLPPAAATLVSALVAAIPYEIIKLAYLRKLEQDDEDVRMDKMLQQQQEQRPFWNFLLPPNRQVDPKQLEPATEQEGIDYVDVFADVIKWLAYDVMQTVYGGTIHYYNGPLLDPALESAFFGLVAGLSSQLYAGVSYKFIGFGPFHKHYQVQQKTTMQLLTALCISCLSGAVLFGVYQSVSKGIADNSNISPCGDANNFEMCLGHYVVANISGTSTWDAKVRALVTALVSALLRLQQFVGL